MKHHLKLLWKHPNKKHLHFFQDPFPVFLLLFSFSLLNWNKSLWSAWICKTFQSTHLYNSSGKNSYLDQLFCPVQPLLRRQRENRAWQSWVDFPAAKDAGRQSGTHSRLAHTPVHRYPLDRAGRRRFRMSLIPLRAGQMFCEHPASSYLCFQLGRPP